MKYPDIFNPELSRIGARESQVYNLVAARLAADTVRTSLGPRGMEKVYIDILGEATITKHGGAFLRKLDVDHPAAKAVVEGVNAVDTHVGDGTATAAVLIGALLGHAQHLRASGVPTASIIDGFEAGLGFALESLDGMEARAEGAGGGGADTATMNSLVDTCLSGKAIFDSMADRESVRDAVVGAVSAVHDARAGAVDVDDIKIEEKRGGSERIELVMGTIIDKPVDSPAMPRAVRDAKVLLINDELEATRTRTESEIVVTSPNNMAQFALQEGANVAMLARRVVESGARVVISRKGIGARAQEMLAAEGIVSVRRAKYNDLWWLEKATGARTCRSVEDISEEELGFASRVYERSVGGDRMVFVESERPRSVTLLLRAVSKEHLDEFHRTAKNAIFVLRNYIERPYVVFGGGACEAAMARDVRERAVSLEGKRQLAASRLADALEEVPATLAGNVGMNPLDALPRLRSEHASRGGGTEAGGGPARCWHGIDSSARRVADMSGSGVVETAAVKRQVLKSAVETAALILNVDDVFVKDLIDNTHCHIDGTVHAHKDPGRNHSHWEQEGLEQRQMHHHY